MENNRVRIVDIADELGLSTATVSNVIHGKTQKISDETVKRVQQKLEEKNYIPNMAGILLAQNNSRIIGIVIHDHEKYEGRVLEDGFIAASLNALAKKVNESGYFLMVKTTKDWNEIPRIASMWNMDGLILIGFCEADYRKLRDQMHISFVVYDGFFEETDKIVNLTIDHYDGGHQAGQYLREMGHKKAVCIADNFIAVDRERIEGFIKGFEPGETQILQIPMAREERMRFYEDNLGRIRQYTAVFAVSDYYALDLIHFFQSRGVNVPEEISVIGFDDNIYSAGSIPPLTTIRQDADLRAERAVSALEHMRDGVETEFCVTLPVKLVVRDSVRRMK